MKINCARKWVEKVIFWWKVRIYSGYENFHTPEWLPNFKTTKIWQQNQQPKQAKRKQGNIIEFYQNHRKITSELQNLPNLDIQLSMQHCGINSYCFALFALFAQGQAPLCPRVGPTAFSQCHNSQQTQRQTCTAIYLLITIELKTRQREAAVLSNKELNTLFSSDSTA